MVCGSWCAGGVSLVALHYLCFFLRPSPLLLNLVSFLSLGKVFPVASTTFIGGEAIAYDQSYFKPTISYYQYESKCMGSWELFSILIRACAVIHLSCICLTWLFDCSLQMMKKRHKIERDLSIGEEVGGSKNQEVAKTNPTLAAMNKKFGMIHGLSSLANLMSFGSLAIHSWYLASKLQL
jgi:hypothetical protein